MCFVLFFCFSTFCVRVDKEMEMSEEDKVVGLPENAQRPLAEGEKYIPVVTDPNPKEWTLRSIFAGILMLVFFSAASAYLTAKLSNGVEIAILIAVVMVGYCSLVAKKFGLLENVQVIAIGAVSGIVVGGAVFVLPSAYILGLEPNWLAIILSPILGSIIGVVMLTMFRDYFINKMHGRLPFPEATTTTNVLMAGDQGGKSAITLFLSVAFGFIYDFLVAVHGVWSDTFTTKLVRSDFFTHLTEKTKVVAELSTSAVMVGLGFIIGLKYVLLICGGSVLATFFLIPLFAHLNPQMAALPWDDIASGPVKQIGIGAIFTAAIVSIIKMSPIIFSSMKNVIGSRFAGGQKKVADVSTERWQTDMSGSMRMGIFFILAVMTFVFFRFLVMVGQSNPTTLSLVATAVVFVVSFLFTAVSAWAIATISVTPISGMTITGIVVTAAILIAAGLNVDATSAPELIASSKLALVMVGCVVCTALSMSGSLITQFKIGGWLGATPKKIQWSNIVASVFAAIIVGGMIILFNQMFGYVNTEATPNPMPVAQANAIAGVINAAVGGAGVPWEMYGFGALIVLSITMIGVPAMPFALGMFLPFSLNAPLILGALVAWLLNRGEHAKSRAKMGETIANGLIAGGALAGVAAAVVRVAGDWLGYAPATVNYEGNEGVSNWFSLIAFVLLAVGIFLIARRAKNPKPPTPPTEKV